jgi:hypothetical protein
MSASLEGSEVLEKLAAKGLVDVFYEAIDADDFARAASLMKKAGLDAVTIKDVLRQMGESDGRA